MRDWNLPIVVDASREQPLFVQIAHALAEAIRGGRLKSGDALPGSRVLAASLGVTRNTVVAGYDELVAEGFAQTRGGAGTFVAASPMSSRPPARECALPTYALPPPVAPPPLVASTRAGVLRLDAGIPDSRLFPSRVFARAFRRALERGGRGLAVDGDACGQRRLRAQIAAMLAQSRGLAATADTLMVARSVEQGIDLVARCLVAPGDVVAVEAFGYPPAWSVLRLAGARLAPVPLDADGLDVDALASLAARVPLRAVFVTPHHQFPTTVAMSPARRERLARLALVHRFAIIEDDYDHEFHYTGRPLPPIAAGIGAANTIYVGSLANLLSPGVATAFVCAPPPVFERLASLRAATDARGDAALECALAELYEDGELPRHVRRMRGVYARRRDALVDALRRRLGGALAFRAPDGGLALWARVDDGVDVAAWERAALAAGVVFRNAQAFDYAGREDRYVRLGFGCHDADELDEAARRLAASLPRAAVNRRARSPPRRAAPCAGA